MTEDLTLAQFIARARVMHSFLPDDDERTKNEYVADELEAAGYRLTAPPTDDEREALAGELMEPLFDMNQRAAMHQGPNWSWLEQGRIVADAIHAAGFRRPGPITSDDPVPRYAQCDLWQALFGIDTSGDYEAFRAENSYADTWSWLLDKVRRRPGPITDAQVDAAFARFNEKRDETWYEAMRAAIEAARDAS